MALDNYANLKTAVKKWSNRNDISDVLDDIISMVESDIYSTGSSSLRVREMQVRSSETTPTSDRFLALPEGFLSMRRLSIILDDFNVNLDPKAPIDIAVLAQPSMPCSYTITSQIEFNQPADQAYNLEMAYYRRLTALSSENPTNEILTKYPNVYLFGCVAAAFMYAGEEDKAQFWNEKFVDTVAEANQHDQAGQYGPAPTEHMHEPIP